jgi:Holliday junction resolvase
VSNYRRGYDAERRTLAAFKADGYVVWRPGGSLGEADLVCAKPGQLVLVQVKTGDAKLADKWWNDLYRLAQWLDAVAVVADWPKRGHLRLRKINGPHHRHSKLWPCRQFLMDEIAADKRWRSDDQP